MTTEDHKPIKELHAEYERLVGGKLTLTLERIYWWQQWMAKGWRLPDLQLVLRHILSQIKEGRRYHGAMRWSTIIQQADKFEEEVCLARAEIRNRKPSKDPKASVIRSLPTVNNAPIVQPITAKPIAHYIDALRAAAGGTV